MSTDVSNVLAALDTAYADAKNAKKATQDESYLAAIGADKLRHYLGALHLCKLHKIIRANGYGGSVASLRKQLAAMGVREVQEIPDGLRAYHCRAKGCDGKLVKRGKGDGGGYVCDKCGAAHRRNSKRCIVLVRPMRKDAEKPETPPVQQAAKQPERPAQQSAHQLAQQSAPASAAQDVEDFEGLFARRGNAMRVE